MSEQRILPGREGALIEWREFWSYKDLLFLLVRRDFLAKYSQTILGPLWFVVQPLLMTATFTVVFRNVANLSTDQLPAPLFYMAGLLGWNYVNATFLAISNTFIGNIHIFSKVYFPRLIVPFSFAISNLLTLLVQLATFAALFAYYKCATISNNTFSLSYYALLLPLVIAQSVILALGLGLCIAAATAKYRDIVQTLGLFSQIWLYATPVIYPASKVPQGYQWLVYINPMAAIVECFRSILLGRSSVNGTMIATSCCLTAAIALTGVSLFRRVERTVVDFV